MNKFDILIGENTKSYLFNIDESDINDFMLALVSGISYLETKQKQLSILAIMGDEKVSSVLALEVAETISTIGKIYNQACKELFPGMNKAPIDLYKYDKMAEEFAKIKAEYNKE